MIELVEIRSAEVAAVDYPERRIKVIVVPYNEPTVVAHPYKAGVMVEEHVEPGAFDGIETRKTHVTANRDHDHQRVMGLAVDYDFTDSRGLVADVEVADTQLGEETLKLAARGILKASIGMLVRRSDGPIVQGKRAIKRAFLDHIAFLPNPAYGGAKVLDVRDLLQAKAGGGSPQETPFLDEFVADELLQWANSRIGG